MTGIPDAGGVNKPLPQEVGTTSCAARRFRNAGPRPQEITACPATEDRDRTPSRPELLPDEFCSVRAQTCRAVMPSTGPILFERRRRKRGGRTCGQRAQGTLCEHWPQSVEGPVARRLAWASTTLKGEQHVDGESEGPLRLGEMGRTASTAEALVCERTREDKRGRERRSTTTCPTLSSPRRPHAGSLSRTLVLYHQTVTAR